MNKLAFVLLVAIVFSAALTATGQVKKVAKDSVLPEFTYVDKLPEFPGDVNEYIRKHMKYPEVARARKVEGRVVVRFSIDEYGNILRVQVIKSIHPLLDSEAVRLVRSMPAWKPGILNGKPVLVSYTLPVYFRL